MKIVKTAIRFPPGIGGAEKYLEDIADKLYKKNHKIKIITTDLKQHTDFIKLNQNEIDNYRKEYEVIRAKTYHIPKTTYPVSLNIIKEIFNSEADILHAYCIHYQPAFVMKMTSILKRNDNYFITPIFDNNNVKLYFRLFGSLLLKSKGTIFISDYEKDMLEKRNFKIRNSIVIPPSLEKDFNIINNENINYEKFDKIKNYSKKILFVGRISKGKGIDILINSSIMLKEKLNDFAVIICGTDFGFQKEIEKIIKSNSLDNIFILNNMNKNEIKYLYKETDMLVLPSRYEAFGIVMIEAMSFGKPVIGMNNSAIPYLIKDKENGLLFKNEDVQDLTDKILLLFNSKDLVNKLKENSRITIEQNFDWNKNIEKLLDFYVNNN